MSIISSNIPIKNIYYMLCYVFDDLKIEDVSKSKLDDFENIYDLYSYILCKQVKSVIKRGLLKNYVDRNEVIGTVKGKINLNASINRNSFAFNKVYCDYEEVSINCSYNQIIKTVLSLLLRQNDNKFGKEINSLLVYFAGISIIDLNNVDWSIQYNKSNKFYKLPIMICYLIHKNLITTEDYGNKDNLNVDSEQFTMSNLYEKFVLKYYLKHYPKLHASSKRVEWKVDKKISGNDQALLPKMKTDCYLEKDNKVLIIDTKYYTSPIQRSRYKEIWHSNNLYQIFTYVKNCEKNKEQELEGISTEVAGMLLYAKPKNFDYEAETYSMSGNDISIRTLDLNTEFTDIASSLDGIVNDYFMGVEKIV